MGKVISEYTFKGELGKKHWRTRTTAGKARHYNEIKVLQFLEDNFINEPKIDHYPFAKLINTESCTIHSNCHIITLTHCGITALENAKLVATQNNIQPVNLYNTIECIINNLRNNLIRHSDTKADNVCINKNGYVSLIDFERANFENIDNIKEYYKKPDLNDLENKLYSYVGCAKSDHLMERALIQNPKWFTAGEFELKWHQYPGTENGHYFFKKRSKKWINPYMFKRNPWSMLFMF